MTDSVTGLTDAENAVADALDTEAAECETPEAPEAPGYDDPWHVKSRFVNALAMDGAVEAVSNVKRLLGLAEDAAAACESPKDRAEKLVEVADRWKYLLSL